VVLNRQESCSREPSPVEMSSLNHMTHHALPQTIDLPFQSHAPPPSEPSFHAPPPSEPSFHAPPQSADQPMLNRERSHSEHSVEAMMCEESAPHPPTEAWSHVQPVSLL